MTLLTNKIAQQLLGTSFSISATYIHHLIPIAEDLGICVDQMLVNAGIDQKKLSQPDYRIPLVQILKLQALQQEQSQDESWGIKLGAQVRPRFFQVLGYAAMSSESLEDAIQQLIRFETLVWDLGISEFKPGKEFSKIQLKTLLPDIIPTQIIELAIAGWVNFGREIIADRSKLDQTPMPITIHFRHKAPADLTEHQNFFNCTILFEQKENAVVIANTLLTEPTRDSDPHLKQLMNTKGDDLLKSYRLDINLSNEVRALICQQLPQGEPDIEQVAAHLKLPVRTLRKRLQESDTNFKTLLEEVRFELAQAYLMDTKLSLIDIAFMLGFSEQSAFSRAFKRWYGSTPSQYRSQIIS